MPSHPDTVTRPSRQIHPQMYDTLHPSFTDSTDAPVDTGEYGNSYEIIPTAHTFFKSLKNRIRTASNSVDLQFYTLEADKEVLPILDASMEAAQERDVTVRIQVDHLVSDPRQLISTLAANRKMRRLPNVSVQTGREPGKLRNPLARDHKKIVAIDVGEPDEFVCVGGINLANRSLRWNDFMVNLGGPIAGLVHQDFEDSWEHRNSAAKVIPEPGESGTFLLTDSHEDHQIVKFLQDRIRQATSRIWLETPYLDVPGIGAELIEAKRNHPSLDVKVTVPRFNNYPVHRLRANSMLSDLSKHGIETYQYGVTYRRLNHTKLLLIDDAAAFGSSNFNLSSMAGGNAEIEVVTQNPQLVSRFEDWYTEDIQDSIRHDR